MPGVGELYYSSPQVLAKLRFFLKCKIRHRIRELGNVLTKSLSKTPNSVATIGFNKDKFVINPSSTSQESLKMFKFLGILLGKY